MSKQSNQKYQKERNLTHREFPKDSTTNHTTNNTDTSLKNMPSREGFGDGNSDAASGGSSSNSK